jgi:glycosyltransferase-like protein LARGE
LALDSATTDFVLNLDVDFLPSKDALQSVRSHLQEKGWDQQLKEKKVLVLPAFEFFPTATAPPEGGNFTIPVTKSDLKKSIDIRESAWFQYKSYPPGHGPTNYKKWFKTSATYPVKYESGFEPYFIAGREGLPRFWDGFVGFGFNKVTWVDELAAAGYELNIGVLDVPVFLLHLNHMYKKEDGTFVKKVSEREPTKFTWYELCVFRQHLGKKYNRTRQVRSECNRTNPKHDYY